MFGVKALYAARGLWRPIAIEVPPPPETSGFIEGIDVSHWQGVISWPDVAAAGKRFAFMKASEGVKYVDPTYATNRAQANANGLKVGAYHFAKPDTDVNDATIEADHFVDTAQWSSGDLLPVLDLGITGGMPALCKTADIVRYALNPSMFRESRRISRPPRGHIPNMSAQIGMPAAKKATPTSYKYPTDPKPKTSSLKRFCHSGHRIQPVESGNELASA